MKCVFPGCPKSYAHRHHIIYKPPMIKGLCRSHHEDITVVNTNEAFKKRRKLSNTERLEIWEAWLAGELVPEMTPWAASWIGRWEKKRKKSRVKGRKGAGCRAAIVKEGLTPYPSIAKWTGFSAKSPSGEEVFLSDGMKREMRRMIREKVFV